MAGSERAPYRLGDMTHAHHCRLHDQIGRRLETRTWIHASRRRHVTGQAAWALADHLRCCHGARRINHQPIPVLIDLHGRLHAAASR